MLRRARLGAGLSQAGLAVRAGVAQSVISAYEAGRRQPALPTLARLIDATGYDLVVDIQWRRVPAAAAVVVTVRFRSVRHLPPAGWSWLQVA